MGRGEGGGGVLGEAVGANVILDKTGVGGGGVVRGGSVRGCVATLGGGGGFVELL